ncbi:MAG: hypothetical protein KAS22_00040 [Candidatus Heimdallarchaeota archaeon]|nr:hypothetical protein [Candidatus Heimdallarchaeota archaeon]MCK5158836.1 hypothetical protein [Candidatus Heimdallarchaeota archaeon]
MSAEERLYKQLEGIVSSIINALEGLEKELSEYIEVTDKRIHKLEDKVHKFESLADVSGKGLVKAIETSKSPDQVKGLAHLATQSKPAVTPKPEIQTPVIQPKAETPPAVPHPPSAGTTHTSKVPPVPLPPSFKPVMKDEPAQPVSKAPTTPSVPRPTTTRKDPEEAEEKEDKDKKELMSALKKIDEL